MGMCHLFFSLLRPEVLFFCGPALRDKGPLHAVGVCNPSENFPGSVWVPWLTLKLRFNVASEKTDHRQFKVVTAQKGLARLFELDAISVLGPEMNTCNWLQECYTQFEQG